MLYISIIVAVIIVGSPITTLSVGFSSANKDEGNNYTVRTGRNIWLQTVFYFIGTALFIVLLFVYAL